MIQELPTSNLESIASVSGCRSLYIVDNSALRSLLLNRNIIGQQFRALCLEASRLFVRHLADELDKGTLVELIILSKGLAYQLSSAVASEIGRNLPTNVVATSRVKVSSNDAKVEVSYSRFDAVGSTLIIGDTVASGATIVVALDAYRRFHEVKELYLLSYAGATTGARRIQEYCDTNSISCTMLFGLASFGLGSNGFDLSFIHPETITKEEYRCQAREQFDGKPVSAVGWDFGSQAMSPEKYAELCWVEAELHGLHGSPSLARERRPTNFDSLSREKAAFSAMLEGHGDQ